MRSASRILFLFVVTASIMLTVAVTGLHAQQANPSILQGDGVAKGIGGDADKPPISLATCTKSGNCSIEHILLLANSIIRWAVAISGSIALLMYVLGGVWMIFSQGNSSRVERGKDIIVGTSISLIFILGGWLIIQFALQSLGVKGQYQLVPNDCFGKGACPHNMRCSMKTKKCEDLCQVEKAETDTTHPWSCRPLGDCGIATINGCAADPVHCAPNLCLTLPPDVGCCWKPEP